jgi:uncharacterized protein YaeQ
MTMIKTASTLQERRRKIYMKAKADKTHRFRGLCVHVCKQRTLSEFYQMASRKSMLGATLLNTPCYFKDLPWAKNIQRRIKPS